MYYLLNRNKVEVFQSKTIYDEWIVTELIWQFNNDHVHNSNCTKSECSTITLGL